MINLSYDLHIHSCLSPCGDDDMTPGNIAGMASIKGLDVIAVTDHNSCRNCPAVMKFAQEYGVLAIPGMEINTSEEVHAVCLFPTLEAALNFDGYVYERLMKFPNRKEIFGKQQIWELTGDFGGVMFPAHVEKSANSLIANLGFVPPDSRFKTAELKDLKQLHRVRRDNPYLEGCRIISNSDAHYLEHIQEPERTIPVREKSVEAVLDYLRGR